MEMDLAKIPKVKLHVHLDCSLSFRVVQKLRPQISKAQYENDFIAPLKCLNPADFLKRTVTGFSLMQTRDELNQVTEDLFEQLAEDNVIYAEIRFAPLLHTGKRLKPEQVVEIVDTAVSKEIEETGVEARLILCTLRHFSKEQSRQTAKLVQEFKGSNVVALDPAADEAGFPIGNHIEAFRFAIEQNLPRIAHAGEAKGPESVWEILDHLKPSRIGHGVRSIEDSSLIKYLIENNVHLEVCPSCNIQIDIYKKYEDHPIDQLFKSGVSVGINTDARTLVNINLTQE
jgi:adenosine deaminase